MWLQLGITSPEARATAEDAGLLSVGGRCLIIEQRRLGCEAPRRREARLLPGKEPDRVGAPGTGAAFRASRHP